MIRMRMGKLTLVVGYFYMVASIWPTFAFAANDGAAVPNLAVTEVRAAEVILGGITVCRFTEPYRGATPLQRTSVIYQRLWSIIDNIPVAERNTLPDTVNVTRVKGDYVINVGNSLVVTIDEAHARINKSSPQVLAEIWAANLQRALQSYIQINAPKQ